MYSETMGGEDEHQSCAPPHCSSNQFSCR
ncbi:hypothetical protein B4U80_07607, partial [Leptotrombidium deliense]